MATEDKKSLVRRLKAALVNGAIKGIDAGVEHAVSEQFKKPELEENKKSDIDNREDRIRSLELALAEQRKDYDQVDSMYESAKGKNYSMFAVTFGLLAFLYTNNGDDNTSIKNRLFIPEEAYGIFIYAVSALLIIYGIKCLVMALKARPWSTAFDNEQDDNLMKDYEKYLAYMKKRYMKCSEINSKSFSQKRELVDEAFWPLLIGGTLLVVIKTLGG